MHWLSIFIRATSRPPLHEGWTGGKTKNLVDHCVRWNLCVGFVQSDFFQKCGGHLCLHLSPKVNLPKLLICLSIRIIITGIRICNLLHVWASPFLLRRECARAVQDVSGHGNVVMDDMRCVGEILAPCARSAPIIPSSLPGMIGGNWSEGNQVVGSIPCIGAGIFEFCCFSDDGLRSSSWLRIAKKIALWGSFS